MLDVRPSLRDRKKDATRQAIEDAAWALFTSKGFDETTVHEIAERANVAPRTFFRYFPTKEAVLFPELDGFMARMAAAYLARPASEPALVALINALDEVNADTTPDANREFERFQLMKNSGTMPTNSQFVHDRVTAGVVAMVHQRYADQPDVEVMAQLVAGVTSTVMTISREQWLTKGCATEIDDEARRCYELLRTLVGG